MSGELDDLFGAFDGGGGGDDDDSSDDSDDDGQQQQQSRQQGGMTNQQKKTKKRTGNDDDDGEVNDGGGAGGPTLATNGDTHQEGPDRKKARRGTDDKSTPAAAPAAASTYSSLMSQPTATSQLQMQDTASAAAARTDEKDERDGNNNEAAAAVTTQQPAAAASATAKKPNLVIDGEIATGTSHDKSVRSYTAYPKHVLPGSAEKKKQTSDKNEEPAKIYDFTLDPFQQQAVNYIDNDESVLVAAHTSAGKTAVAEYAIAKSLKRGQRVVYTSPIKALSNQKFRDLQEEFDDVGLMTGDITINPQATCLVMTTEILRSMLYRGSELIREVAWVIYDEIHYMRDVERGVVWEESIILLPHHVRFVFLSATIPNANQFADWIATIHLQPCHVVYTNYRPTPLQHYIFPQGGTGLHLVVDEKGKFREQNFQTAMTTLQQGSSGSGMDAAIADSIQNSGNSRKQQRGGTNNNNKRRGNSPFNDLHRIVKLVMERNLDPVIVFSFSKKDCEKYALALNAEDYTDDVEKDLISQVYMNAIESLSETDRTLPQVVALLPLLKRGIGIHHGGLLPILKEIVEILFSEGLVKTLFATETFSIGINMPAKTVVFTNTRKWDGQEFRWVTSGEYIQMSGRAGRRGKDTRGIVIQMLDEQMEPTVCKNILYGTPDPLNSSYKISYNMLLNLLRVEDVDPEYLLRASFHQYQREMDTPALLLEAESLTNQANNIEISRGDGGDGTAASKSAGKTTETIVSQYNQMDEQLHKTRQQIAQLINQPQHILRFLQEPGRLVDITVRRQKQQQSHTKKKKNADSTTDYYNEAFGWGLVVSCKKKVGTGAADEAGRQAAAAAGGNSEYTMEVLLNCVDRHFDNDGDEDKPTVSDDDDDDDDNKKKAKSKKKSSLHEDRENTKLVWKGSLTDCRPVRPSDDPKLVSMRLFTLELEDIERLSAIRLFVPADYTTAEARNKVALSIKEVHKRMPDGVLPLLDPVTDLGIKDDTLTTLLHQATTLTERLKTHELFTEFSQEERLRLLQSYKRKKKLLQHAYVLREEARLSQAMTMKDDLKKMKRVLKRLGHVNTEGIIQTKGRTACEINTANELIVVELIFTGVFNNLSVEQCVALLSCMTFDERMKESDDDPLKGLPGYLTQPFYQLQEVARTVIRVEIACGIEIDEDDFINRFNPGMMEAVYAWCKGAKFIEVQKLTGSFEGTTIRTLRRLEELVRQIAAATKAIGNHELQAKFEKGSELIKRDIVFCSSLYL